MAHHLRVGVIGAGRAGLIHARAFAWRVANAQLVALSDPSPQARASAQKEFGVPVFPTHTELLDSGVDAVVVVTPTKFHRDIVCEAAAAGKHVLCEKPMAMDASECEDMIAATDAAGVKLQIGFMRRFDAGHRRAKAALEAGQIGEVVSVTTLTHGPSIPHPWMYDLSASNGPLAEVSSHDIDMLRWLTGSEVVELQAFGGNYRSADALAEFPDFYDTFLLNARFASGALGHINGAQGVRYGYDSRVEIHGTHGRIDIGGLAADRVVVHKAEGTSEQSIVDSWRTLYRDAYVAEDSAFATAIADDSQPLVTGRDGLAAVRIVNAGNAAIASGHIQRL
ncbi:MAG: Gfo/Idh/MocA family oxidoreductase [Actinomycetaceae bacterium]|nr:Gfo/Idh/MocA family oxidoreductase [Actinomycetaceae bacterium]